MATPRVPRRLARRAVALTAVLGALVLVGSCGSNDDGAASTTTAAVAVTMVTTPPDATRLGVCRSFTVEQMRDLLGSATVPPTVPEAIREGAVTGETCGWQRTDADGGTRTVRVEARDYGADTASLDARFQALEDATAGATDLPGVQDRAFTASSDEVSVVQVRSGPYLLTATSRGTDGLAPLTTAELGVLLGTTFEKLP